MSIDSRYKGIFFMLLAALGFSVMGAGLCLASAHVGDDETVETGDRSNSPDDGPIKPRGCGLHAQSLHPVLPGPGPGG